MQAYLWMNRLAAIALSILIGGFGALGATVIGLPMPYLIGAFFASGIATLSGFKLFGLAPNLPMPLRNVFVGIIGVMIGGSFHPGIFSTLSQIWVPALAVIVFVTLSLAGNYALFRRFGGYDRATAFFAAMPGGLIESISMGEKLGADIHALTLQQFSRISLVITAVPFIFLIWTGEKVGSAAGIRLNANLAGVSLVDWSVIAACVILGMAGGRALRLPASILVGPLMLSAAAHYFGLTDVGPPAWLVALAQVFVGAGLGARFRGFGGREMSRVVILAVVSVTMMLVLDILIVVLLRPFLDIPFEVMFISFAPGGVTETALIALSLHANPVFVTSLHVFRIIITVVIGAVAARKMAGTR